MSSVTKLDIGRNPALVIEDINHAIPPRITEAVDDIWNRAILKQDADLFNGAIFCVHKVEHDRIGVFRAEYKQYYAQITDPLLVHDIHLHPLACSGVLTCEDGIILGRRSPNVALEPNVWELAPAGTFDEKCVKGDTLDATTLLLNEAEEELGMPKHVLQVGQLLAVFRDEATKAIDLVVRAHAPISDTDIYRYFRNSPRTEYSRVEVVKPSNIGSFLDQNHTVLNSIVRAGLSLLDI